MGDRLKPQSLVSKGNTLLEELLPVVADTAGRVRKFWQQVSRRGVGVVQMETI